MTELNKPFYMKFLDVGTFKKKDVIKVDINQKQYLVLKVYKGWNFWKKFIAWLGFKVRIYELKVKEL